VSLLFDGVSDIDTGFGRPWMQNVPGGTITAWVRNDNLTGTQTIWGAFGNTGTTRAKLSINATGAMNMRANALDSDATSSFVSSGVIVQGARTFVCAVFFFSSKSGAAYINGVLDTNGVFANMTAGNTSNTVCHESRMGANETGVTNSWIGEMEDVRVYNRALGPGEIATLFAAKGKDSILQGLQVRWPGSEGAPGVAAANIIDLSQNRFGGVVGGSVIFRPGITTMTHGAPKRRPGQGNVW